MTFQTGQTKWDGWSIYYDYIYIMNNLLYHLKETWQHSNDLMNYIYIYIYNDVELQMGNHPTIL